MQPSTNAPPVSCHLFPRDLRSAFTLVEILVVITIIGILAGLAIPAIVGAIARGKQTAQKLEINALAQAVEQYQQKYGDYPPDGSSQAVLDRHMRKVFPRMAEPDLTLLTRLTDDSTAGAPMSANFSGVAMDRAEALVFFLGGFSKDVQHPLTGTGGPLDYRSTSTAMADRQNLDNYQYNATRDNAIYDFKPERLTMARASATAPLLSTDETELNLTAAFYGGNDVLPTYRAVEGNPAPIIYFDSRTYGVIGSTGGATPRSIYNGYRGENAVGGIRPYKTETVIEPPPLPSGTSYGTEALAFQAIKFHNPNTFQIISPGSDGLFGSIVSTNVSDPGASMAGNLVVHFVTESGRAVRPLASATTPAGLEFTSSSLGSKGYQDRDWDSSLEPINGHLDNITNFSGSTLENDLQ